MEANPITRLSFNTNRMMQDYPYQNLPQEIK